MKIYISIVLILLIDAFMVDYSLNCQKYDHFTKICLNSKQSSTSLSTDNCLHLDSNSKCTICEQGYILFKSSCVKSLLNCKVRNISHCIQCLDGYILSNNHCIATRRLQSDCVYFLQNVCQQCNPNYTFTNNICILTQLLPQNCRSYSPDLKCLNCFVGFVLEPIRGQCISAPYYIKSCVLYNSNYFCIQCDNSSILYNSTCYTRTPPLINCVSIKVFSRTASCVTCMNNTILVDGRCIRKEELLIKNCKLYSSNYSCKQCADGYLLNQNICLAKNIVACAKYNLFNQILQCTGCISGYFLIQNRCYTNNQTIDGCIDYTYNKTILCVKCNQSLIMYKDICILPIANCLLYNSNSTCFQCLQNFNLQQNLCCRFSQIVINGSCINKLNLNCISFKNNQCLECKQGYTLNNSICFDSNCHSYLNFTCTSCKPNYILSTQQICIPSCSKFINNKCVSCIPEYQLFNQICTPIGSFCKKFQKDQDNVSSKVCRQCYQGFFLIENKCKYLPLSSDPYCTIKDIQNLCVQCIDKYYLSNAGRCISFDNLCVKFNNKICRQCIDGYTLKIDRGTWKCILSAQLQSYPSFMINSP